MRRQALRRFLLTAVLAFPAMGLSCQKDGPTPPDGVIEVGRKMPDGTFAPLAAGETIAVVPGPNGLNMIVPSLRAVGIDPRAPDPTVTVEVAGIIMAADLKGVRVDMEDDGTGYVLWSLNVPFQTKLCCYNCTEGLIVARIRDASGRTFVGEIPVTLARGTCPDPVTCCLTADQCPDPEITQVCQ